MKQYGPLHEPRELTNEEALNLGVNNWDYVLLTDGMYVWSPEKVEEAFTVEELHLQMQSAR